MKPRSLLSRLACLVAVLGSYLLIGAQPGLGGPIHHYNYTYPNSTGSLPPANVSIPGYPQLIFNPQAAIANQYLYGGFSPFGYPILSTPSPATTPTNPSSTPNNASTNAQTIPPVNSPAAYPIPPVGAYPGAYPAPFGTNLLPPNPYSYAPAAYPSVYPGYGTVPVNDWPGWSGYPGVAPVSGYPNFMNVPSMGYTPYMGSYPYSSFTPPSIFSSPGVPVYRGY